MHIQNHTIIYTQIPDSDIFQMAYKKFKSQFPPKSHFVSLKRSRLFRRQDLLFPSYDASLEVPFDCE